MSRIPLIVGMILAAATAHAQSDQQAATQEKQRAAPMFQSLDTNSDGTVSQAEFMAGHEARRHGVDAVDANKDGIVSRDEFIHGGQAKREARFKELDANGDGQLTQDEMAARATAMFSAMDKNADGKLTPDEMHSPKGMGPRQ